MISSPQVQVVKVPQQFSPLTGRVWEVSVREARCYSKELAQSINNSCAMALTSAGKGADLAVLEQPLNQVKQLLEKNAPWREMEPLMRGLLENNQGPAAVVAQADVTP